MSNLGNKKALTARSNKSEYDVGYAKPPKKTRFQPGQSGNPTGRPKGSKNHPKPPALNEERMKTIILEEAYRSVSVNDQNGQITIPMAQAVIRSMAVNAAKGNQRAQHLFTQLISTTERENKLLHDEYLQTAIEYKVDWEKILEHRKQTGATGPDPLPHPDHIKIDFNTGNVSIMGPMTKEEKIVWDGWKAQKLDYQKELVENEQLLIDNPNHEHRQIIQNEIEFAKKILSIMEQANV